MKTSLTSQWSKKPATADPCKRLVKVTETYQVYQSLEIKTGFHCFHMLSQLIWSQDPVHAWVCTCMQKMPRCGKMWQDVLVSSSVLGVRRIVCHPRLTWAGAHEPRLSPWQLDAPGTGSTGSTGNSLAKYSACETITALKMHRSTVNFSWHLECEVLIFPLLPKTPGIGLDVAICSLKMPKAPSQTYPRYQKYSWHYSTIHSYFPYVFWVSPSCTSFHTWLIMSASTYDRR